MKIYFHRNDYELNVNRKAADGYGGVGYYRVVKVAEYSGQDATCEGTKFLSRGKTLEDKMRDVWKDYDVFWCPYFYHPMSAAVIFSIRDELKKKIIIDLDDNFWDIDQSNALYDGFRSGQKDRAYLGAILSLADAIVVSTYPLKEKVYNHIKNVQKIEKPVFIIPNLNDLKDWPFENQLKDDGRIVIGYSGSTSHYDDLQLVLPSIIKLMKKYDNLWFEMLGLITKDQAIGIFKNVPKKVLDRMALVGATDMFTEYPEWLSKKGWMIGIAPLVDTAFTRAKSSIKYLEYSMMKIPTVASRVYPYSHDVLGRKVITDRDDGFLVEPHEWEKTLEELILNEGLRKKIGDAAYLHVKNDWQYDASIAQKVSEVIKSLELPLSVV